MLRTVDRSLGGSDHVGLEVGDALLQVVVREDLALKALARHRGGTVAVEDALDRRPLVRVAVGGDHRICTDHGAGRTERPRQARVIRMLCHSACMHTGERTLHQRQRDRALEL